VIYGYMSGDVCLSRKGLWIVHVSSEHRIFYGYHDMIAIKPREHGPNLRALFLVFS
jgi:hypothetical protein